MSLSMNYEGSKVSKPDLKCKFNTPENKLYLPINTSPIFYLIFRQWEKFRKLTCKEQKDELLFVHTDTLEFHSTVCASLDVGRSRRERYQGGCDNMEA